MALYQLVFIPRLLYASVSQVKGGGVEEAGLPRAGNPSGFGMRRLVCDIGVFRLRGTRCPTPGRTLEA